MKTAKELEQELKEFKAQKLAEVPFKTGDAVTWVDAKGNSKYGRVGYKSYSTEKDRVSVKVDLPVTRSIGWTSAYEIVDPSILKPYKTIDQEEELSEVEITIASLQRKLSELKEPLENEIHEHKQALHRLQQSCLHVWGTFYPTGETKQHVIGTTEVEEAECEICGAIGRNC